MTMERRSDGNMKEEAAGERRKEAASKQIKLGHANAPSCSSPKPKTDELDRPRASSSNATCDDDDNKSHREATFPQQLMDVIEKETNEGVTSDDGKRVLEWLPEGDAFVIRDKAILEKHVLPRHFTAKCKFLSFVRKLYRWGFHQRVENNAPGEMVFLHANFIRGDKQRCLLMRSIVNKKPAEPATGFPSGYLPTNSMFGMNSQYNMDPHYMNNAMMAQYQYPSQAYRSMFPTLGQGHDNIMDSTGVGLALPSSLPMRNQFVPGPLGIARDATERLPTSTEMFEAGLRLERMEQRNHQRQIQRSSAMSSAYSLNKTPSPLPPALNANIHADSSNLGGNMSELELASDIIKQNPGMETWRALELARRWNH